MGMSDSAHSTTNNPDRPAGAPKAQSEQTKHRTFEAASSTGDRGRRPSILLTPKTKTRKTSQPPLEESLTASVVVGAFTFYLYSNPHWVVGLIAGVGMAAATFGLLRTDKVQGLRRTVVSVFTLVTWISLAVFLAYTGLETLSSWIGVHQRVPLIPSADPKSGIATFPCPLVMPEVIWTGGRLSQAQQSAGPGVLLTFPPSLETFLVILGLYVVSGLLLGKAWCGWICPFGGIGEVFTGGKKRRWSLLRLTEVVSSPSGKGFPGGLRDEVKDVKYGVLLGTLLAAIYFSIQWFCIFCWAGIASWIMALVNLAFFIGILVFFFMVLPFLTKRRWCQTFCPIGAGLGLMGKISPFKITFDKSICTHDYACAIVCPTGAISKNTLENGGSPSSECDFCSRCLEFCPAGAIKMNVRWGGMAAKPWFIPLTSAISVIWFVWFVQILLQLAPKVLGIGV